MNARTPKSIENIEDIEAATVMVDFDASTPYTHLEPIIDGRYELLRPLGEGGFSWVFLARHVQIPSMRVAIKVLKVANGHDPRALNRLEREATVTATLQGRHTVKVQDVGVTEAGYPYLAMEYVRGVPLRYLSRQQGPLDTLSVARLSLEILASLRDAHSHNIVHRDLKPSNVFVVQPDDGPPEARVLDFGIAHLQTPLTQDTASSKHSLACTPQYAAPELLRGEPDPRSDLYALGLIMAELLDGARVVNETNTFVAATAHLSEDAHKLGSRTHRSALAPIILAATDKNIQRRPADATAMFNHIQALVQDLESQGATSDLDLRPLIERYITSIESGPSIDAPLSLRSGMNKRHTHDARPVHTQAYTQATDDTHALLQIKALEEQAKQRQLIARLSFVLILIALLLVAGLVVLRGQKDAAPTTAHAAEAAPLAAEDAAPREIILEGSIRENTTLHAATTYRLRGIVFVEDAATLTIEPGTTIVGEVGAALVLTPNATIYARGRRDAPITFTSSRGADAEAGDWGGVVLLGDAPINVAQGHVEGVPQNDARGHYGGDDVNGSCGVLEYVRIAYAGFEVFANNELNGLTLAGCGEGTIVRHLHVHASLDDGVEVFGGTPDLSHILITDPGDDGFDWDQGWTGNAQFVAIILTHRSDNGIEADSNVDDHDATPRSLPTIANLTIIGPGDELANARAMLLRRGTGAHFINTIVHDFPIDPIDIRDDATIAAIERGALHFDGLWLSGGSGGLRFEDELLDDDDDGGFLEADFFEEAAGEHFNVTLRDWVDTAIGRVVPVSSERVLSSAAFPRTEFFDRGARYLGAFRPGEVTTWADGWAFEDAF